MEGQAHTFHHLMMAWRDKGNRPLAIYYGKLAVDGYQDIRRNIVDLDSQLQNTYIKSKEETYRVLAGLLIKEDRFPEAEQILELLKGEEFREFVGRDEKAVVRLLARPDLTDDERKTLEEFRRYAADITAAASEFGKLEATDGRSPHEEEQFREAAKKLEAANLSYRIFLAKLTEDFAKRTDKSGEKSRIEQLRNGSLQSDLKRWPWSRGSVVLYTIMGEDKYRVVLTTPDTQTWGESDISAESLNNLVWEFRRALQGPEDGPAPPREKTLRRTARAGGG